MAEKTYWDMKVKISCATAYSKGPATYNEHTEYLFLEMEGYPNPKITAKAILAYLNLKQNYKYFYQVRVVRRRPINKKEYDAWTEKEESGESSDD